MDKYKLLLLQTQVSIDSPIEMYPKSFYAFTEKKYVNQPIAPKKEHARFWVQKGDAKQPKYSPIYKNNPTDGAFSLTVRELQELIRQAKELGTTSIPFNVDVYAYEDCEYGMNTIAYEDWSIAAGFSIQHKAPKTVFDEEKFLAAQDKYKERLRIYKEKFLAEQETFVNTLEAEIAKSQQVLKRAKNMLSERIR